MNIRAYESDGKMTISGQAIVYDKPSNLVAQNLREVIVKGALDNVDLTDLLLLRQHDSKAVMARVSNGTLDVSNLSTDGTFTATLPDTQAGKDLYEDVKSGLLPECSFGFLISPNGCRVDKSVTPNVCYVDRISLVAEISVVAKGAYSDTHVSVLQRAIDDSDTRDKVIRDRELNLRIRGLKA